MDTKTYQELSARTECNQIAARTRLMGAPKGSPPGWDLTPVRLNHGAFGIVKEGGELLAEVEKWIYYGQPLDVQKCKLEIGDVCWYVALACNALGLDLGEVLQANIDKLRVRFPDTYKDYLAKHRDPAKEARAISSRPDIAVRTKSQVLAQRQNTVAGGCCNRFADQMPCDCLEKAVDDA